MCFNYLITNFKSFIMSNTKLTEKIKQINILVVDDANTMRRIIRMVLSQIGFYNVDEAESGANALEMLKTKNYGLVITDCNMPEINGIELTEKIRANESTKNIPIIMITAESNVENVIRAKKAGVNNYIVKPFTADALEKKITLVFALLKLI